MLTMIKRLAVALTVAAIASCAPVDAVTRRHTTGQPPEYQDGFLAGCGSGYVAAGHPYSKFAKDVRRYEAESLYRQGWDDGMTVCRADYESVKRDFRR